MTTPDVIRLTSAAFTAKVDPQGAQLVVLRDAAGRDLLWNGDAAWWNGRAPVLFPIVGSLHGGQYRWRGQRYALPRHGFARNRRFEVLHADAGSTLLRLGADAGTRAVYPFAFELDLSFVLDAALTITATVRNTGPAPLPASLGFHPAFLWPLPGNAARDAHAIWFDQEEAAPVRRLDAAGLLRPDAIPSPAIGRRLTLHDDLFRDDVLIFDALRSRALVYGGMGPNGAPAPGSLRVAFPDATHLGLWTKPGAPFVCIEPWRGVADPAAFDGEFDAKPGVFVVAPGESAALTMRISSAV